MASGHWPHRAASSLVLRYAFSIYQGASSTAVACRVVSRCITSAVVSRSLASQVFDHKVFIILIQKVCASGTGARETETCFSPPPRRLLVEGGYGESNWYGHPLARSRPPIGHVVVVGEFRIGATAVDQIEQLLHLGDAIPNMP